MADNKMEDLKFSQFCKLCEKIRAQTNKPKAGQILGKFIDHMMKDNSQSFFPIMRLLLPQLDRKRGPYGVKETNLARTYKRILGLAPNSAEAKMLTNFTSPSTVTSSAIGDFAEVLCCILRNRCGEGGVLTIEDINKFLDSIALKHAEHNPRGVDDEYTEIFQKTSNIELKWIVRIILKSMDIGLGVKRILNIYHPDANEVYVHTNCIHSVCEKLKNRSIRLYELEIELFQAFKPMLCERADVHNISINSPHYVETKMDGERFQIHYKERVFKYFSRNNYDYTDIYGENPEIGNFTKHIMNQLSPDLENCILDGEMMGWHTVRKKYITKAHNIDVKKLRLGSTIQPCFCVFDILMYNGTMLLNKPLSERIEIVKNIFTPLEGVLVHVLRKTISTTQEAFDSLNYAIDNNEEGIIIKDPSSVYKPNSRKSEWRKLKPDYSEGTTDLDVLIIGGYFGSGRRKGMICHFLLGVAEESNGEPEKFMSMGRASSGINDEELDELSAKLNPHWVKFKGQTPSFLLLKREKPDVFINPRNSVILQVKSPEVVHSDAYYTEYTLRFVRIERIRYDKLWSDCLRINEFTTLRTRSAGKLTAGHILPSTSTRKRKQVLNNMSTIPCKVEKISELLSGKDICIVTGDKLFSKEELEKMVKQHGGSVTSHPNSSTFCVLYGDENIRVRNVIKSKIHNVAKYTWLLNCIQEGNLVPWNRINLVSSNLKTEAMISKQFDSYGDEISKPLSLDSLRNLFDRMPNVPPCSEDELKEVDNILFKGPSQYSLFRNCYMFFDLHCIGNEKNNVNANIKNAEILYSFHAGTVCDKVSALTSHVIMDEKYLQNLSHFKKIIETKKIICHFVSFRWIIDSFKNKMVNQIDDYVIYSPIF